ncbi:MAG: allantoicase [Gammaproteobacteria bacterium]|nr:allantoicase [Gammaproteobacteria bacterium]
MKALSANRQADSPHPFGSGCTNLAATRLGARVIHVSDEFFAECRRMLDPQPPLFQADRFDDHGKWMDGWETRRRRRPGYEHSIVRLGRAGVIRGVNLCTRHFTGNYPPSASIDACLIDGDPDQETEWSSLLPAIDLQGDADNLFEVRSERVWSHLRLNIYPDGGIARLRVFGEIHKDWSKVPPDVPVDLAALENGGRALCCNDAHFGAMENLILPGAALNMGDGWETRRRRQPGHDWVILALGHPGRIVRVEVDTSHFKGNYPDRCSLQAAAVAAGGPAVIAAQSLYWEELLGEQRLKADRLHCFDRQISDLGTVSHVRFCIHPDGGVARLRLWGLIAG